MITRSAAERFNTAGDHRRNDHPPRPLTEASVWSEHRKVATVFLRSNTYEVAGRRLWKPASSSFLEGYWQTFEVH